MEWATSHDCCLLNTSQHTAKHIQVEADSRVLLHFATAPASSMRSIPNKPRSHSKNIFAIVGLPPGPDCGPVAWKAARSSGSPTSSPSTCAICQEAIGL